MNPNPPPVAHHSAYRADIDGLRALAVLLVMVFHAFPGKLAGGFAGVDVFFVISGYLISGIILTELAQGDFSLQRFYARRVRRIFPALLMVLLTALVLGWLALTPQELAQLGQHVAAGAGFASNLLLWTEVGYFDEAAEKKPLLHLWSLGVEEQFYFIAPLLLAWLYKSGRAKFAGVSRSDSIASNRLSTKPNSRLLLILGLLAVASFTVYVWLWRRDAQSAFYLPHARFWELLAGALLATWQHRANAVNAGKAGHTSAALHNTFALVGVAFLLGFLGFSAQQTAVLGGAWLLLPVLGAVALLAAPSSWVNQTLLAARPLVAIGKISYPLYLWHWLLLVICRWLEDVKPFYELRNPAVILTFVLAWLTYIGIEKPLRFGRWRHTSVWYLVLAMLVVLMGGLAIWHSGGMPQRAGAAWRVVNQGDLGQDAFRALLAQKLSQCDAQLDAHNRTTANTQVRCGGIRATAKADTPSSTRTPRFLVVGDSHAEHLMLGLAESFAHMDWRYSAREGLPLLSNAAFRDHFALLATNEIDGIVLAAQWTIKPRAWPREAFERELQSTLAHLLKSGKPVVLLDDVPMFNIRAKRCAYADRLWVSNRCDEPEADVLKNPFDFAALTQPLITKFKNLRYANLNAFICDSGTCRMAKDGQLLYRDQDHLGIHGSRYVAERLRHQHPTLFQP